MSANKLSADKQAPFSELRKRVNAEIQDNFDEDIELELEDSELADLLSESEHLQLHDSLPRRLYFKELLRLQRELIKLQDWVVAKKLKLVVIFEGRNSAGKGGAIKRVTQRLNPRVFRAVAFPPRPSASAASGTSSATSRICRPAARSCCSTAAGTTAPASNG